MRNGQLEAGGIGEQERATVGFDRIVVGFDERTASRDALVLARELSEWFGSELIVASVRPYWPDLLGPARYPQAVAEDEAWLRREAGQVVTSVALRTKVIDGNLEAEGLKHFAAREHADLILVGSTHRGRLGRVLPGSFGEKVLNNAPCAVGVAPLGLAVSGLAVRCVAVGYDGSMQAAAALEMGISLAESASAKLLVLGAVKGNLDDERLARHLERAAAKAAARVQVDTALLRGDAGEAIVEAAGAADLLVVGSRGHYGSARRLFLGSVATELVRSAPCATLIAPIAWPQTA